MNSRRPQWASFPSVPPTLLHFSSAADTHGHLQLQMTPKNNFYIPLRLYLLLYSKSLCFAEVGFFSFLFSGWHCSCHLSQAKFIFSGTSSSFLPLPMSSSLFNLVGWSKPCSSTYTRTKKMSFYRGNSHEKYKGLKV